MKKAAIAIAILICVVLFATCELAGGLGQSGQPSPSIGKEVSEVKITHILMGQVTEWKVSGDELEKLRKWIDKLEYEPRDFEEGNTPGDGEGQEVYWFEPTEGEDLGFDYVICGPGNCYLSLEGKWYAVSNPSDPPVKAPPTASTF